MVAPARIGSNTIDFLEDAAAKPVERNRVEVAQDLPIRLSDVARHGPASASGTASLDLRATFNPLQLPN
jgi:hypothetical protein